MKKTSLFKIICTFPVIFFKENKYLNLQMNFVVYVLSGDILSLGNTHFTVH